MKVSSNPNDETEWGRFNKKLKRAGAWVYKNVLPPAVSVLTGGVGMGAASAPLIKEIIRKLRGKKLQIQDENTVSECIGEIIGTGGQVAIEKLSTVLQQENPGIPADTILGRMDEVIKPVTVELEEMIDMLEEERSNMREILHGWLDEQEQRLPDESNATRAQIQAIRTGLDEKPDTIQVDLGDIKTYTKQVLTGVSDIKTFLNENLKALFRKMLGNDAMLEGKTVDDAFQLAKNHYQNEHLASRYDIPYNPARYIPPVHFEKQSRHFLQTPGDSFVETKPLFLLLGHVGLGKTWNVSWLGEHLLETQQMLPVFINLK
ncbi:MAG: hypothetical protein ACTSU9_15915, partial [Promethearchaeota archaeon]